MVCSGFCGHLYAHGTHELMQVHTYTLIKTNKNCMASHANPSTVENFVTFFFNPYSSFIQNNPILKQEGPFTVKMVTVL